MRVFQVEENCMSAGREVGKNGGGNFKFKIIDRV